MKTGAELITEERQRQIRQEGYSVRADKERQELGELTAAALCYAAVASAQARGSNVKEWPVDMFNGFTDSLIDWPWAEEDYKPSADPIRNLTKAGALIAAEIDRLTNHGEEK